MCTKQWNILQHNMKWALHWIKKKDIYPPNFSGAVTHVTLIF